MTDLLTRLSDEADLCRNEGADDIAKLLDEAHAALSSRPGLLAGVPKGAALHSVERIDTDLWQAQLVCANDRTLSIRDVYGSGPTPEQAVADAVKGI